MKLSVTIRKWLWIVLILFYLTVIFLKIYNGGLAEAITPSSIGFYTAVVALAYTNLGGFKKTMHGIWYWIIKMQFEWQFISNYKCGTEAIEGITEKKVIKFISEILVASGMKERIKDIQISYINQGFVVYISPFGINLKIERYSSEDPFDDEASSRLIITGHTLLNYRQTRKMLKVFIKMFFARMEEELVNIQEKRYTLRVSSGEMDSNFYKDQFIKGIEKVDHFSISSITETYTVVINKKFIEIISKYKEDIVEKATNYLLLVK